MSHDPERLAILVPVAAVAGAASALVSYGLYTLWKKAYSSYKFHTNLSGHDEFKLLSEAIQRFSETFTERSATFQKCNNEFIRIMEQQDKQLDDEQSDIFRQRQTSLGNLLACFRAKPDTKADTVTRHEATQRVRELDEYLLQLNKLTETFLAEHAALINILQPRPERALCML